ncbi:MAG TPA: GtrA family protein [Luteimonas sp.]|nr:GtrA family protein [Luteimonas sp.]
MSVRTTHGLRTRVAFLACGASGFALYTAFSLVLVRVAGLRAEQAAFAAVMLAIVPTFLLQKHVAFRHRGDVLGSFAKYCMLQGCNAVAIAALAWAGRRAGLPDVGTVVISGAVVVALSWMVLSGVVFRGGAGRR